MKPDYLITVVVTLIPAASVLLAKPLEQFFILRQKKSIKKLLDAVDTKSIIDLCSDDFRKDFITHDLEENYFFAQTGIRTHWKSIPKYIELKNKLTNNFTWDTVRYAQRHLKFNDEGLYISVSKLDRFFSNVILVSGFSLFLIGALVAIYYNKDGFSDWRGVVVYFTLIILFFIPGYFFIIRALPFVSASYIERRLNEVTKLD